MKIVNLGEKDSVMNQFVAELRDVNIQKDRMRFRNNIKRIGNLMAYEISKSLRYQEVEVETPLATAKMRVPYDNVVIGTVFRAGLPSIRASSKSLTKPATPSSPHIATTPTASATISTCT